MISMELAVSDAIVCHEWRRGIRLSLYRATTMILPLISYNRDPLVGCLDLNIPLVFHHLKLTIIIISPAMGAA